MINKKTELWQGKHSKELNSEVEFGIAEISANEQFDLLEKNVSMEQKNMTIIEVGAGNGTLSKLVLEKYGKNIKKYVIVEDTSRILNIQNNYLSSSFDNVEYVEIDDVENINEDFDLFMSHNCLEETPYEYQDFIFNKFLTKSKIVYVTQNVSGFHSGSEVDAEISHKKLLEHLDKHYDDVLVDKIASSKNIIVVK